MVRNCVHDGGVVAILFQHRKSTALTAAMSLLIAEPADDAVAASFVIFLVLASVLSFAGMLALPPVGNVISEAEIPVTEVVAFGGGCFPLPPLLPCISGERGVFQRG